MHNKLPSSSPRCSLCAKNCMNTRIPVFGALGPFPDEPLLSSLDRVLFWLGCKNVQNSVNSERSSTKQDDYGSRCSVEIETDREVQHTKVNKSPTHCVVPNTEYSKCDKFLCKKLTIQQPSLCHFPSNSEENISISQNLCRKASQRIGKPVRNIARSFSLCSLACRKLKEKLKFAETTSDHSTKWLWTKMQNYGDGIQVFEVFKNSSTATHPTKFDTCKAAKIIFIILPTGFIMPFETLPRH